MSIEALIKWYEDRKGKVSYSMARRNGPNSYDCSSSLYYALWAAGFTTRISYPGNTETLFKEKGYLFEEINASMAQRGDIFVAGVEGASLGAFGHTGVHYGNGKIIHCNGADNGISITTISGRTGAPCRWFRIKGRKTKLEGRSIQELAQAVIRGEFGVGEERKRALGAKYDEVQKIVSDIFKSDKADIEALAKAVMRGEYGTGTDREKALGSNYTAVQKLVNELFAQSSQTGNNTSLPTQEIELSYNGSHLSKENVNAILSLCRHYDILPTFAFTVLHFESMWGYSKVGQLDNNWAGMTMTTNNLSEIRPSGVVVTQGTARPSDEGGYYMHYATVEDFLKDWFFLIRNGGSYKVAGKKSFSEAIKGMFKAGGAKYDYAAVGYEEYLVRATTRLKNIEKFNGPLSRYDGSQAVKEDIKVIADDLEVIINGIRYVPVG